MQGIPLKQAAGPFAVAGRLQHVAVQAENGGRIRFKNEPGFLHLNGCGLVGIPNRVDLAGMDRGLGKQPAVDVFHDFPLQGYQISNAIRNRSTEPDALCTKCL